jgi:hypothetical protein
MRTLANLGRPWPRDPGGAPVDVAPQPHETVWALATAGVVARCLQVIAELGVADRIGDGSVPVDELGSSCGVDPGALDRVLRLVVEHGVFEAAPVATPTRRRPACWVRTTRRRCGRSPAGWACRRSGVP